MSNSSARKPLQKGCVIAVHGVGATKPGDTLAGVEQHFSKACSTYYSSHDVITQGARFPGRTSPETEAPDLLEVNWSDVGKPAASWASTLSHVARILIAMLRLSACWKGGSRLSRVSMSVYRILFEATTIWSVPLVTYVMALVSVPDEHKWIVVTIGTGLVIVITIHVWSWSRSLRIGGCLFAAVYLALGISVLIADGHDTVLLSVAAPGENEGTGKPAAIFALQGDGVHARMLGKDERKLFEQPETTPGGAQELAALEKLLNERPFPETPDLSPAERREILDKAAYVSGHGTQVSLTQWAAGDYVSRHRLAPFMILFLICATLLPIATIGTWQQRLARFGSGYLPFLGVAIVGALLWVLIIPAIDGPGLGFGAWHVIHEGVLSEKNYNLKAAEWFHLLMICAFAAIIFTSAGIYVFRRMRGSLRTGLGVRNTLPILVGFVPIGLVVVALGMLSDQASGWLPAGGENVYDIYKISALRVIPFLPLVLGPMAIILDVIGDVVFLELPKNDPLSIREETSNRMKAALDHATANYDGPIVVLAHSLGSVIALRELCRRDADDRIHLVTIGSPISSLHGRFLGWDPTADADCGKLPQNWHNIYRYGDYVGGEIEFLPPSSNQFLEKRADAGRWDARGGHIKYWDDEVVIQAVVSRL